MGILIPMAAKALSAAKAIGASIFKTQAATAAKAAAGGSKFLNYIPAIGQGANIASTLITNRQQAKTNLDLYNRQRIDALADWNRQNEYNSPAAQMQRYKDAGLSPHLIYGQQNTAPAIRSTEAKAPNFMAPSLDTNALLMSAQLDNIKANTLKTLTEAGIKVDSRDYIIGKAKYASDLESYKGHQMLAQTEFTRAQTEATKQLTSERVKQIRASAQNLAANTDLVGKKKDSLVETIENLKKTRELLTEKVKIEKFEAEAVQKIKAFGTGASTVMQILNFLFRP
jgi:hypothetical protein